MENTNEANVATKGTVTEPNVLYGPEIVDMIIRKPGKRWVIDSIIVEYIFIRVFISDGVLLLVVSESIAKF